MFEEKINKHPKYGTICKNRLEWFCNLWHRNFWRKEANHRVRNKKEFLQNGGYRKYFYMVMNCNRVRLRSWKYEN